MTQMVKQKNNGSWNVKNRAWGHVLRVMVKPTYEISVILVCNKLRGESIEDRNSWGATPKIMFSGLSLPFTYFAHRINNNPT